MHKYKNIDMTITTTAHARQRIAQRGICQKALALLSLNGMDSPAGAGRVRRELRYNQMAELYEQGYALEVIDKALRLEAIFSNENSLITCYLRTPRKSSRGARRNRTATHAASWRA